MKIEIVDGELLPPPPPQRLRNVVITMSIEEAQDFHNRLYARANPADTKDKILREVGDALLAAKVQLG